MDDLIERDCAQHLPKLAKRNAADQRSALAKMLAPIWGRKLVTEINSTDVDKLLTMVAEGRARPHKEKPNNRARKLQPAKPTPLWSGDTTGVASRPRHMVQHIPPKFCGCGCKAPIRAGRTCADWRASPLSPGQESDALMTEKTWKVCRFQNDPLPANRLRPGLQPAVRPAPLHPTLAFLPIPQRNRQKRPVRVLPQPVGQHSVWLMNLQIYQ